MIKRLFFMCVFTSIVSLFMACNSDDSTKENPGGGSSSNSFNLKGDWKLTIEDQDDGYTETYRFSTDKTGFSSDVYGEISKTYLAYKDKKLTMNLVDIHSEIVPPLVFDAPNPKANSFIVFEEYEETDDNGGLEIITSKITLERLSK